MRNKRKFRNSNVYFWSALVLLSSVFIIVYLSAFGNNDQKFTDIIVENVAKNADNKSAELQLLYILIFFGSLACIMRLIFTKNVCAISEIEKDKRIVEDCEISGFTICALLCFSIGYLVLFQGTNPLLTAAIILTIILFIMDKSLIVLGLCVFIIVAYAFLAIYRIYVTLGGELGTNYMMVTVISGLIMVIPLTKRYMRCALLRCAMIAQLLLPWLLLVFIQSKYCYDEQIVKIKVPIPVYIFVTALIALFMLEAIYRLKKYWKNPKNLNLTICVGSCAAVMMFNFFQGKGAILQLDLHHAFERVIGYSEIFDLGMEPFKEYLPISGMYSIPYGATFKLFGNGNLSNFNVVTNVFFSIVIMFTIMLLCTHLDRSYVLLIATYLCFPDYCQYAFILPTMLLLINKRLIEKKNRWLKTWFFVSFLYGLYYPLYGTAVCVSFIPLGFWQIKKYIVSGEMKQDMKKISFWMWWMIYVIPVILCIPLLVGTFKHITALAGQSIYADGVARFGQMVPDSFLPYMNEHQVVRSIFFYVLSFLIPSLYVWVAFFATMQAGGISFDVRKVKIKHIKETCIGLSLVIMPPIAYTYTAIRMDINSLYARSVGPLLTGSILLIIYVNCYLKKQTVRFTVYCFAFIIALMCPRLGFNGNEEKMQAMYNVPAGYVYVDKDPVDKMGEGFVSENVYNDLVMQWNKAQNLDRDKTYFGILPYFGDYYLFNMKGSASVEIYGTVRGYGAAKEVVDVLRRTNSIAGTSNMDTIINYYFYNWLLTSGEYCWEENLGAFFPVEKVMDHETTKKYNKDAGTGRSSTIGQSASSLGSSFDNLKEVFSDPNVNLEIQDGKTTVSLDFSKIIDGDDADFLYLEFDGVLENHVNILYSDKEYEQKTGPIINLLTKNRYNPDTYVIVSWTDDNSEAHRMKCAMGKGRLLIPLGAGVKWLLHDHDHLTITVEKDEKQVEVPKILRAEMLKVREVN